MRKKVSKTKTAANALLNKPGFHSTAAMSLDMTSSRTGVDGYIYISDCSRQIEISLTYYDSRGSKEDLANTRHKLAEMRAILDLAESRLDYHHKVYLELKEENEKKRAKRQEDEAKKLAEITQTYVRTPPP